MTIDYELRSDLVWSDGEPLTAEDVAYTHEILTEGCGRDPDGSIVDGTPEGCVYFTGNRLGLDQVTDFEVVSDTEFTVTMASFYPDWRRLYGPVLAAHAYGEDADGGEPAAPDDAGPERSRGHVRAPHPRALGPGRSMTLVPNERYHGLDRPAFAEETGHRRSGRPGVRIDFEPDPRGPGRGRGRRAGRPPARAGSSGAGRGWPAIPTGSPRPPWPASTTTTGP